MRKGKGENIKMQRMPTAVNVNVFYGYANAVSMRPFYSIPIKPARQNESNNCPPAMCSLSHVQVALFLFGELFSLSIELPFSLLVFVIESRTCKLAG